jgi:hypothetical protein
MHFRSGDELGCPSSERKYRERDLGLTGERGRHTSLSRSRPHALDEPPRPATDSPPGRIARVSSRGWPSGRASDSCRGVAIATPAPAMRSLLFRKTRRGSGLAQEKRSRGSGAARLRRVRNDRPSGFTRRRWWRLPASRLAGAIAARRQSWARGDACSAAEFRPTHRRRRHVGRSLPRDVSDSKLRLRLPAQVGSPASTVALLQTSRSLDLV